MITCLDQTATYVRSSHLLQHVNVIALDEGTGEQLGAQATEDEDKSNKEDNLWFNTGRQGGLNH